MSERPEESEGFMLVRRSALAHVFKAGVLAGEAEARLQDLAQWRPCPECGQKLHWNEPTCESCFWEYLYSMGAEE